jgi:serine protease inhibitor
MDGARDVYVNTIVHEATVEVDETGTIATGTGVTGTTT